MHTPRILKVTAQGDRYRQRRGWELTKAGIQLQGHWLVVAGFEPGTYVQVQVNQGEILIQPFETGENHDA